MCVCVCSLVSHILECRCFLSAWALCTCIYTFIMSYSVSTGETKQRMWHVYFSCNLGFTTVAMRRVLAHICLLIVCATRPYKSPCKSQSSDYNAGHVLIQTSVTNGCATAWWQALKWLPLTALHAPYNGMNESFWRGIYTTLHGYL